MKSFGVRELLFGVIIAASLTMVKSGSCDHRTATLVGFFGNFPKEYAIPGVAGMEFLPGIILGNATLTGLRHQKVTSSECVRDYINFKSVSEYPLRLVVPWESCDGRSGRITVSPTVFEISGALDVSTKGGRDLVELAGVHITSFKGLNVDFEGAGSSARTLFSALGKYLEESGKPLWFGFLSGQVQNALRQSAARANVDT